MGQFEVLGWLVEQRKKNPDKEFTSEEIYQGMKEDGLCYEPRAIRRCLFPLCSLKYIDTTLKRNGFGTSRKYCASKKAVEEKL